jgi:hypothetical protein
MERKFESPQRHIQRPQAQEIFPYLSPSRPPSAENLLRRSTVIAADIESAIHLPEGEKPEVKRPQANAGTAEWISYFDNNHRQEGLPRDWYQLKTESNKQVGFVMKNQMLQLEDPHDQEQVADWTQRTVRDLEGFKLEFLSKHNVYPRIYHRNPSDATRLEDPMYGRNKDGNHPDIVEITSEEERGGSVKESIGRIKEFLLNAPEGSIAVMASPLGPTGFKDQDGRGVDYVDSYFFIVQNQGDKIINYTIKTDFNLAKVRKVLGQLTGGEIPVGAPLEEYVKTLALIKPGSSDGPQNIFDVVGVLEDAQPDHAFFDPEGKQETRTWAHVYDDIVEGEKLYEFDTRTRQKIIDFSEFAQSGGHSILDLQKGAAATILLMSKDYFGEEEEVEGEMQLVEGKWVYLQKGQPSFNRLLEQTAEIRGCTGGGGGKGAVILGAFGLARFASPGGGGSSNEWFNCPDCNYKASGPIGDRCPGCRITKEQYATKSGKVMC